MRGHRAESRSGEEPRAGTLLPRRGCGRTPGACGGQKPCLGDPPQRRIWWQWSLWYPKHGGNNNHGHRHSGLHITPGHCANVPCTRAPSACPSKPLRQAVPTPSVPRRGMRPRWHQAARLGCGRAGSQPASLAPEPCSASLLSHPRSTERGTGGPRRLASVLFSQE